MSAPVEPKAGGDATLPCVLRAGDGAAQALPHAPWFRMRDTGLSQTTDGRFGAQVFRANGAQTLPPSPHRHDADFQLVYVLRGEIEFRFADGPVRLTAGDAVYQPPGCVHCVTAISEDLELLEITSPAAIATMQAPS